MALCRASRLDWGRLVTHQPRLQRCCGDRTLRTTSLHHCPQPRRASAHPTPTCHVDSVAPPHLRRHVVAGRGPPACISWNRGGGTIPPFSPLERIFIQSVALPEPELRGTRSTTSYSGDRVWNTALDPNLFLGIESETSASECRRKFFLELDSALVCAGGGKQK